MKQSRRTSIVLLCLSLALVLLVLLGGFLLGCSGLAATGDVADIVPMQRMYLDSGAAAAEEVEATEPRAGLSDEASSIARIPQVQNLRGMVSAQGIKLRWDCADDDAVYEIFHSTNRYYSYELLTRLDDTSFLHTDADLSVGNFYKVRAYLTLEGLKRYGHLSAPIELLP
ncbi:MAG: hypothetical protein FWE48_01070 [Coriobacteriia bacterium]|nr:hypothetical protein [Coriobacteriia bacterium]